MGLGVDGLAEVARLWLEAGGGKLPVSGRSMAPTFEDASEIRIAPADRVRFGDVIIYRSGGIVVVHRIVGIRRGPRYRTKGDGRPHVDPGYVAPEALLGRVVVIERGGQRWRTDRPAARFYARAVGALSAMEG